MNSFSIAQARRGLSALACLALLLLTAVPAFATDPITLPTTGVDIPGVIGAVVTAFGTIVSSIVLAYFAFLLVKKGLQWGRKAFG